MTTFVGCYYCASDDGREKARQGRGRPVGRRRSKPGGQEPSTERQQTRAEEEVGFTRLQ